LLPVSHFSPVKTNSVNSGVAKANRTNTMAEKEIIEAPPAYISHSEKADQAGLEDVSAKRKAAGLNIVQNPLQVSFAKGDAEML
jgi:hypothetical protein